MYANLEAEMTRIGIKNEDIAKVINRDERTVRNKRSGVTEFTLNETMMIRDVFFHGLTLEYLFKRNSAPDKEVG